MYKDVAIVVRFLPPSTTRSPWSLVGVLLLLGLPFAFGEARIWGEGSMAKERVHTETLRRWAVVL